MECLFLSTEQISFIKELKYFLNVKVNPFANIQFRFYDTNDKLLSTFHIDYIFDYFKLKGVRLLSLPIELQLNIIATNMCYRSFHFLSQSFKRGKTQCFGHGDFWGIDSFIVNYKR